MTTWGKNGRRAMPRRTVLRGMFRGSVITLGLPTLNAMLNSNGTAYAQTGNPTGTYFGTFHWAHGAHRGLFFPRAVGAGGAWSLNEEMMPLSGFKDYLSIASNLKLYDSMRGHGRNMVILQTGAPFLETQLLILTKDGKSVENGAFSFPRGIAPRASIDQEVVQAFAKIPGEPKKGLVVGVCPGAISGRGPSATTLSFRGYNDHVPGVYDPREVFNDLFGSFFPTSPAGPKEDPRLALWPNAIDIVKRDLDTLMKKVGTQDRKRLDSHLSDLAKVQEDLKMPPPPATCVRPGQPPSISGAARDEAVNEQVNKLMANLVAIGLSCGLSRAFTYNFVHDSASTPWADHGDSHNDASFETSGGPPTPEGKATPAPLDQLRRTPTHSNVVNVMGRLAVLLEALRTTDAGGGKSLLDKSVILCYSDLMNGGHHGYSLPMFLAGKGGGRLKGNVHAQVASYKPEANVFRLHVTALRALGLTVDGYGVKSGYRLPAEQWQPHYWWDTAENGERSLILKALNAGGYPGPVFPYNFFQDASIPEFMA